MNPVEFWWTFLWACGVWIDAWDIISITSLRIKIWTFVCEIVCKVIAAGMLQLWLRIIFGFWDVLGRTLLMLRKISAWKVLLHPICGFGFVDKHCQDICFPGKNAVHPSSSLSIITYHLYIYIYICVHIFFSLLGTNISPPKTLWKMIFLFPLGGICCLPWTAWQPVAPFPPRRASSGTTHWSEKTLWHRDFPRCFGGR